MRRLPAPCRACLCLLLRLVFGIAEGAEPDPLPEGPGLSARYPGDAGLERDPAVLFIEDFEAGTLEEIAKRWGSDSNFYAYWQEMTATISVEEAVRIGAATLTTGEERFKEADALLRAGKVDEARSLFEKLRLEFPGTWIDRVSRERLREAAPRR